MQAQGPEPDAPFDVPLQDEGGGALEQKEPVAVITEKLTPQGRGYLEETGMGINEIA